ncbi:hypothetical protein L484_011013 [Morus notabilis]|uniref:Uncharacterized protein n=1 Tax=Morus notabilis TaxID=981085 RepID=W9R6K7_9ROSA|nr:hypothetical protein L484_011013 [Morus notabilis]
MKEMTVVKTLSVNQHCMRTKSHGEGCDISIRAGGDQCATSGQWRQQIVGIVMSWWISVAMSNRDLWSQL